MRTVLLTIGGLCMVSTLPADSLTSGVYKASPVTAKAGVMHSHFMSGSTLDLENLEVYTVTLPAIQAAQPLQAVADAEELVVVKEGSLAVTLRNSTKKLGPGGLMLLETGDKHRLQNVAASPASYYVLKFKSKDGLDRQRAEAGGGSLLKDWSQFKVVKTDKGETRPVFDRPSSMFKRFDVHATVLNPGLASHPPHTHRTEEIILMTKGNGEILIDTKPYKAAAGDVVLLRANVPHAFTNTGSGPCGYFAIQWHSNAE